MTIDDMDVMMNSYNPDFNNFANAISHHNPDLNGDGLSDLSVASADGLFIYYTINGVLQSDPSVYDPFIDASSLKILTINNKVVYCNYSENFGDCNVLTLGE